MSDTETQKEKFTLRQYITDHRIHLLPILLASFVLVDIAAIFISVNYTFTEIFYLCGIIMILLAIGSAVIILLEGKPIWTFIGALFFGIAPIIEITIHLATVPQDTISLILAIFALILALVMIGFLFIAVPYYQKKITEEKEG